MGRKQVTPLPKAIGCRRLCCKDYNNSTLVWKEKDVFLSHHIFLDLIKSSLSAKLPWLQKSVEKHAINIYTGYSELEGTQ